jgi:hypothetical protein
VGRPHTSTEGPKWDRINESINKGLKTKTNRSLHKTKTKRKLIGNATAELLPSSVITVEAA